MNYENKIIIIGFQSAYVIFKLKKICLHFECGVLDPREHLSEFNQLLIDPFLLNCFMALLTLVIQY